MTLTLVVGIIGVLALLLYFMNILDDEKHLILKLVIVFFFMSGLLLIPKVGIDSYTNCEPVVNTSTVTGAITTYTYVDHCYTNSELTPFSFLKNMNRLYYIFIAYVIVFLGYWAMMKLYESVKSRGQR